MLPRLLSLVVLVALAAQFLRGAEKPAAEEADDDVTTLAPFNVQGDRVEDFGLRVTRKFDADHSSLLWPVSVPRIVAVLPNTAAEKAGLKPGELILKSDGRGTSMSLFSMGKWRDLQKKKWAEVSAGKKNVTWTLEVQAADSKETRTVKLMVPTAAPRWGATVWQAPEGRVPVTVKEPGPLAELSERVLNHGIWSVDGHAERLLRLNEVKGPVPVFRGYRWSFMVGTTERHSLFVSQQRGRTDVVLVIGTRGGGVRCYLTSPSGAFERALIFPSGGKATEIPAVDARTEFQREMDFWLTRVAQTKRWPFELIEEKTAAGGVVLASGGTTAGTVATEGVRAAAFLKLAPATEAQRAWLAEAVGKIGADADRWAYTETSHTPDSKKVRVVSYDPSKPEAERCVLVKIDGKAATETDVKRWREEGRDAMAPMGDLPPIGQVVELSEARVFADERAAVVFEVPIRSGSKEFPAEKFQALLRVNKAQRALEDIQVKLRESLRVVGVVKVTEAGFEAQFQTLDPAHPPQPVRLRGGGAVRLLLVKLARDFEAVRTDFRRVEPFQEAEAVVEK